MKDIVKSNKAEVVVKKSRIRARTNAWFTTVVEQERIKHRCPERHESKKILLKMFNWHRFSFVEHIELLSFTRLTKNNLALEEENKIKIMVVYWSTN